MPRFKAVITRETARARPTTTGCACDLASLLSHGCRRWGCQRDSAVDSTPAQSLRRAPSPYAVYVEAAGSARRAGARNISGAI